MYSLVPYLKGEGIHRINGLFLTHGDTDHLGDAGALIQTIKIATIYLGKGSLNNQNVQKLYRTFGRQVPFREVIPGTAIGNKKKMVVLSPKSGKGENNDSLVLYTLFASKYFLFTGDLEQSGEEKLLEMYGHFPVDVLKVGHHGSKTSTSPRFIEALKPKDGIISCGRKNRYKHPHQETLDTLENYAVKVLRTDLQGMIQYRKGWQSERIIYLKK